MHVEIYDFHSLSAMSDFIFHFNETIWKKKTLIGYQQKALKILLDISAETNLTKKVNIIFRDSLENNCKPITKGFIFEYVFNIVKHSRNSHEMICL